MTFERRVVPHKTAAEVSSQDDSMPKTVMSIIYFFVCFFAKIMAISTNMVIFVSYK